MWLCLALLDSPFPGDSLLSSTDDSSGSSLDPLTYPFMSCRERIEWHFVFLIVAIKKA
jgi:hypothetical protein